jgi:hypothetical protein
MAEVAAFALYLLLEGFARGLLAARTLRITRTVVIVALAIAAVDDIASTTQRMATGCVLPLIRNLHFPAYMLALVMTLTVLTAAYLQARGEQQLRLRWIFWSTVVGYSGVLIYIASVLLARPVPSYPISEGTAVVIPLGYAYAILRHRVIDVAFVVNRAIVLSIITSLIFAVFTILSKVIEYAAVGEGAGITLQLLGALTIAIFFERLRRFVEVAVSRAFFRRKHDAEAALRTLIEEAPFISDEGGLLKRAVAEVRRQLGPASAAIYREDLIRGGFRLAELDGEQIFPRHCERDDPAFVRLRATMRECHLVDVPSALAFGEIAIPLGLAGRFDGALVCASRQTGEPYDPDEIALLGSLARQLSVVLETMRARASEDLVDALAAGLVDPDSARERARAIGSASVRRRVTTTRHDG